MPDLYRMYGRNNQLLYVGISGHAGQRADQHAADKPWWPQVVRIEVEHLNCDRDQLLAYEKRCIKTERPLHNIQHNTPEFYTEPLPTVANHEAPHELGEQWEALLQALTTIAADHGNLAHTTTRNGTPLLAAIDAAARAAHLAHPCPNCTDWALPSSTWVDHRAHTVRTTTTCPTCIDTDNPANGVHHATLTWEQAS